MWILFLFQDVLFQAAFQPKISCTNYLLWYPRCHHEFTGYFQKNKWRISDSLVVLIAAAVCIQSYVHLPGKRGGILWNWKQQRCRRQCTSLNYLFQHFKERKALFREDARQDCCTTITVNSSNNKTVKASADTCSVRLWLCSHSPIKNLCSLIPVAASSQSSQILNSQRLKWKLSQDESQISFNLHENFPLCLYCLSILSASAFF